MHIRCALLFVSLLFVSSFAARCMLDTETQFYYGPLNLYTQPTAAGQHQNFTIADVVVGIQQDGNIVATEIATGIQVWTTGVTGVTCTGTGGCRCIMQGDGNFVCSAPNQGGYWATWTYSCCNNPSAAVGALLSSNPPYLQMVNSACSIVWSASNAQPRTVTTPTYVSTGMITRQALPVSKFANTFGVGTHLSQGWNVDTTIDRAHYIGAKRIRDGVIQNYAANYAKIHAAGIKMNVLPGSLNMSQTIIDLNTIVQANPGLIESVEGFNEVNNWPFTYNGINPSTSYKGMAEAMSDLYNGVKNSPVLHNIPVYMMTAGNSGSDSAAVGLNQIGGFADYANIHPYSYNGDQSVVGFSYFSEGMNGDYPTWQLTTPRVITELGWPTLPVSTNNPSQGVSMIAQAKLTTNSILDAILQGFSKIFVYELLEERWGNTNSYEEHFGLFNFDLTPKPAGEALHIINGLLNDSTDASPLNSLTYSISGLPITHGKHILFQMHDTPSYWLAIWNTATVFDSRNQVDVSNPTFPVTVQLGTNAGFTNAHFVVYNPFSTLISGSPTATQDFTNTNQITFQMSDYVQLVQILPIVTQNAGSTSGCSNSNLAAAQADTANTYQSPGFGFTQAQLAGILVGSILIALIIGAIVGVVIVKRNSNKDVEVHHEERV